MEIYGRIDVCMSCHPVVKGGLAPCISEGQTGYCQWLYGEMDPFLHYDVIDPGVSHACLSIVLFYVDL